MGYFTKGTRKVSLQNSNGAGTDQRKQGKRVEFAKKFSSQVESNSGFLKNVIFTDEAHFELSGFVNTQNARIWSDKQPYATHIGPRSKEKVTVWMGLSHHGVFGPYFFENSEGQSETVKSKNYIDMLRTKLVPVLKRKKIMTKVIFQQDGAPPHTSNATLSWLKTQFGDRVISRRADFEWPAYSPDLNPADFFLWGYLKDRVYSDPIPRDIDQLKENIRKEARKINKDLVIRAIDNMLPRTQNLLSRKGAWFEKLLKY